MMRRLLLSILATPLVVAACNSDGVLSPPDGLTHAAATRSCGPADGPAVAIYLAPARITGLEPAKPYVRLVILKPAGELVGSWSVASGSGTGWAYRTTPGSDTPEFTEHGSVQVTGVGADSTITGTVDIDFSSGPVRGGFSAHWIPNQMLCG